VRLFALADYERQMTIETINAFADASMKVIRAAAALHVDPNTVRLPARPDQRSFGGLTDLQCIPEIGALLYVLTGCVEIGRKLLTTLLDSCRVSGVAGRRPTTSGQWCRREDVVGSRPSEKRTYAQP
jgi:hypothetical protein